VTRPDAVAAAKGNSASKRGGGCIPECRDGVRKPTLACGIGASPVTGRNAGGIHEAAVGSAGCHAIPMATSRGETARARAEPSVRVAVLGDMAPTASRHCVARHPVRRSGARPRSGPGAVTAAPDSVAGMLEGGCTSGGNAPVGGA
jgi:hypothetical protein